LATLNRSGMYTWGEFWFFLSIPAFADSSLIYRTLVKSKWKQRKIFIQALGLGALIFPIWSRWSTLGPGIRMFPANKADLVCMFCWRFSLDQFRWKWSFSRFIFPIVWNWVLSIRNNWEVDQDFDDFKIGKDSFPWNTFRFQWWNNPIHFSSQILMFFLSQTQMTSIGGRIFFYRGGKFCKNVVRIKTFANNSITYAKFIPLSGPINLSPVDFGNQLLLHMWPYCTDTCHHHQTGTLIIQLDSGY